MHLRSLERFAFDSVLLPYSHVIMQDEQYAADFGRVLATCNERDVAVQTIKGIARGPWGSREHTSSTWYEPLVDQREIDLAVHWVLGEPRCSSTAPATSSCCRACSMPPSASARARTRRRWSGSSRSSGSARSSPEVQAAKSAVAITAPAEPSNVPVAKPMPMRCRPAVRMIARWVGECIHWLTMPSGVP